MQDWIVWAVGAGMLVILELFTGTFYLLMIALGLLAGTAAAWFGAGMAGQALSAAAVGAGATAVLHRSRYGRRATGDVARNPDVNLDVGQQVHVPFWQTDPEGRSTARVSYRGAHWDVELAPGAVCTSGPQTITAVRGSRLIVAPR